MRKWSTESPIKAALLALCIAFLALFAAVRTVVRPASYEDTSAPPEPFVIPPRIEHAPEKEEAVPEALVELERDESSTAATLATGDALSPTPEESPQDALKRIVLELKSSRDPTKILAFVDWKSAFRRLSPTLRKALFIHAPGSLREYYRLHFTSAASALISDVARSIQNAPADKQKYLVDMIRESRRTELPPVLDPELSQIIIEIVDMKTAPEAAYVEVYLTRTLKTEKRTIRLVRVGSKWLLDCPQFVADPLQLCRD